MAKVTRRVITVRPKITITRTVRITTRTTRK